MSKNRLDKIYTRSGDTGKTSLALGERLSKSHDHIKTLGEIDELNCQIGIVLATLHSHTNAIDETLESCDIKLLQFLSKIQNTLFNIGAHLAMNDPSYPSLEQSVIDELEQKLDAINQHLPPLKEFILPGGNIAAAHCHLARAVCRRAERQFIAFTSSSEREAQLSSPCFAQSIKYINRLSDFLFVGARYLNHLESNTEVYWQA